MREKEIKETIAKELRKSFHVMTDEEISRSVKGYSSSVKDRDNSVNRMRKRQPPPTNYNPDLLDRVGSNQKAAKAVAREVEDKIEKRFGIVKEKQIDDTPFRIDLFDEKEKVCYEICLGDGAEIFKDIVKALIIKAKKLVVFCRSYPDPLGMTGYDYARRHWAMLKGRFDLEAEVIDFMS